MPLYLEGMSSSSAVSGQDEVALGPIALLLVADQVGDEHGGHRLVVRRAARA